MTKKKHRKVIQEKPKNFLQKHYVIITLIFIAAFTFLVRCFHLFEPGHYYIISADSHLFHWMASNIMHGQSITRDINSIQPSGLAYPLAYISLAISFVFHTSKEAALDFTSKFLPPFIGVVSCVLMYLLGNKLWNKTVGLCSAFILAVIPHVFFIQGAGYLDRDGFSLTLVILGIYLFVRGFKSKWSWLISAFLVLLVEVILFIEWGWLGSSILLVIILSYCVLCSALRKPGHVEYWKSLLVVIGIILLAAIIKWDTTSHTLHFIRVLISARGGDISELQGMTWGDIRMFQLGLMILTPIGFVWALIKHDKGDLLCIAWIVILGFLSIFARRFVIYLTPAVALLASLLLANMLDLSNVKKWEKATQVVLSLVIIAVLIFTSYSSKTLGNEKRVAMGDNWNEALLYIKDNTPVDSKVVSWWDFGYWILDVADRKPVVDGGLLDHSERTDKQVGIAYCASSSADIIGVLDYYKADYLIFSGVEREIITTIAYYGSSDYQAWMKGGYQSSIWWRVINGDFSSDGKLKVVYSSNGGDNVVVLGRV